MYFLLQRFLSQSNLLIRNGLIRNILVLRNHFLQTNLPIYFIVIRDILRWGTILGLPKVPLSPSLTVIDFTAKLVVLSGNKITAASNLHNLSEQRLALYSILSMNMTKFSPHHCAIRCQCNRNEKNLRSIHNKTALSKDWLCTLWCHWTQTQWLLVKSTSKAAAAQAFSAMFSVNSQQCQK